ncbi:unnamed protein product [Lasius platythorax]|uniref:Uncharacterized protein n=1 Tax=Lasius platythorax TaxID=488582 RepID=A0AAV2MXU3_9HYME
MSSGTTGPGVDHNDDYNNRRTSGIEAVFKPVQASQDDCVVPTVGAKKSSQAVNLGCGPDEKRLLTPFGRRDGRGRKSLDPLGPGGTL